MEYKFRVLEDFPFSPWGKGDTISPKNDKDLKIFRDYPRIFQEVSIQFEILSDNTIKRLIDGKVFCIGDRLTYSVSWWKIPLAFILTGWTTIGADEGDIHLCSHSNQRTCGIRKVEIITDPTIEYKWI